MFFLMNLMLDLDTCGLQVPIVKSHRALASSLADPRIEVVPDLGKFGRPEQLHLAFAAVRERARADARLCSAHACVDVGLCTRVSSEMLVSRVCA